MQCRLTKISQVWPAPFGRDLTKEEAYIQKLDGSTGASLKLTVLNPEGRIWTMVAGGGASVVYSDAIAAHGFAHELANYGEYSGAPTEGQTYEYAKTISEWLSSISSAISYLGSRSDHSWKTAP
jgi:ATP citrate (pro-S)-lyase